MANRLFDGEEFAGRINKRLGELRTSTRYAANEVGISPAALCRAANNTRPDISHEVVLKIEAWLERTKNGRRVHAA